MDKMYEMEMVNFFYLFPELYLHGKMTILSVVLMCISVGIIILSIVFHRVN